MANSILLDESWKEVLKEEFEKPYFQELKAFLVDEKRRNESIFPPGNKIFAALGPNAF
jgi:uracil-DNA glycosylase